MTFNMVVGCKLLNKIAIIQIIASYIVFSAICTVHMQFVCSYTFLLFEILIPEYEYLEYGLILK